MRWCCPPGHGCNAPDGGEPCALALCKGAAEEESEAAVALDRWRALQEASKQHCGEAERRFRRRAFERARDRALITLAMHPQPESQADAISVRSRRGWAPPRSRRRSRAQRSAR